MFRAIFCRPGLPLPLALALTLPLVSPAFAQTDQERAQGRAAANAGVKAFGEGQWAQALDLFTRAESLVHAPTHLLYLARSQEKLGHLVGAQEAYLKALKETLPPKAPVAFREAQTSAQAELTKLEPRVPTLTIVVDGPGRENAAITMDGQRIPAAVLGIPTPTDPGAHQLQADAAGRAPVTGSVTLSEGAKETVTLHVEAAIAAMPVAAAPGPGTTNDAKADPGAGNGRKIAAYGALGVGVVGLGLGTFFVVRRGTKLSDTDTLCAGPGGACGTSKRDEIESLDSAAASAGTASIVAFAVGGVGIATGVTLLVLGGKSKRAEHVSLRPSVSPWVSPGSAGLRGTF